MNEILIGIASNVLTLALVAVAGGIYVLWIKKRKLSAFFGLGKDRRFIVYLSNIFVTSGGSLGIDGKPRSYDGHSVSFLETDIAKRVQNLLQQFLSVQRWMPDFLKSISIHDIDASAHISPRQPSEVNRASSFLALGSPGYNAASYVCEHLRSNWVEVRPDGIWFQGAIRLQKRNGAVVMRQKEGSTGRVLFYAAGPSEAATIGAANYLLSQWKVLSKRHKGNFVVFLTIDENDINRWSVDSESGGDSWPPESDSSTAYAVLPGPLPTKGSSGGASGGDSSGGATTSGTASAHNIVLGAKMDQSRTPPWSTTVS